MSSTQKDEYKDYDFRLFPFDLLSLNLGVGEIKPGNNGHIHIPTCIIEDGIKYNYTVKFSGVLFYSKSFIEYQDTSENKKDAQLAYYCYPKLHPDYEKKDANGIVLKTRCKDGDDIEKFFDTLRLKIEELINERPPRMKSQITGSKNAQLKTGFIQDIVVFPEDKYKQPDRNQSPTLRTKLWVTKKVNEKDGYTQDSDNKVVKEDTNSLVIPGTNPKQRILTKLYRINKKQKTSKLWTKFDEFKEVIYSKHKNYGGMKDLIFGMEITAPVLHSSKGDVDIQITASKKFITSVNSSSRDKELSQLEQNEWIELTNAAKKEHDIKDDEDINDDSTIEEIQSNEHNMDEINLNDSPPALPMIRKRKREDIDDDDDDHKTKKLKMH